MVDFKKNLSNRVTDKKTNPVDIYGGLDRKSIAGPLRLAQSNILTDWFERRYQDKDLIVKLHTGEGKTLIGLLMLQSKIHDTKESCVYVCPSIYLVKQVCSEAEKFGIPYCTISADNIIPDDFVCGRKVLITHAQKLFNGKSIFGLNNLSLSIGTIVLDDSHACIDVVKQAFTITLSRSKNEPLYSNLLSIFRDELADQGEGSLIDIENGEFDTFMPVPYWSWNEKKTEVLKLLSDNSGDDEIQFAWSLVRDRIHEYACFVSGSKIEISPYSPNISVFGVFSRAKHRILMSATTQDDSFFIKGLSFDKSAVLKPLVNKDQKWSGEKMVIVPSLVDENNDRELVISRFAPIKQKNFGIVALVPSTKKAMGYAIHKACVTDRKNIFEEVSKLKEKRFGTVLVINNRYDGIDLPDESCRILILDSIPYFDNLAYKYEEQCRPNSVIINKLIAQKIEQGLGRGVRGEKDYCAILIVGSDLVKFMRSTATNKYFSAQTRKQIEIGLQIAELAVEEIVEGESSLNPIISLVRQMLNRDEGWKAFYSTEMNDLVVSSDNMQIYDSLTEEMEIERLFSIMEYEKACARLQQYIDNIKCGEDEKGWYLQQLARYTFFVSKEKSVSLQQSAFRLNYQLLKPRIGVQYKKISYINENRMHVIRHFISKCTHYNELQLQVDSILNDLTFSVSAERFENALQRLGELLGFASQRPDKEIRKGPDNLWCDADSHYLLFECKSEVDTNRSEISKAESGQMNNHCAWFRNEYGEDVEVSNFLIIPTKTLSFYGDFTHDVRIIRAGKLRDLKLQIKNFVRELKDYDLTNLSAETLQKFIDIHQLNSTDFVQKYSEEHYHKKKR